MAYTIRYNRNTNHLQGVAERTQSKGGESGGVVNYYAESACGVLTKGLSHLATGRSFESLADAVAELERTQDRNACKRCLAAAKAQLDAEEPVPTNEPRSAVEAILADVAEETAQPTPRDMPALVVRSLKAVRGGVCAYSLVHARRGIPAVTTIVCGPVGEIEACQQCAEFYERQGQ